MNEINLQYIILNPILIEFFSQQNNKTHFWAFYIIKFFLSLPFKSYLKKKMKKNISS